MSWLGPAIGAVGNLVGGLFGLSSQSKANKINQQNFRQQLQWQRDLAQHGLRWRVEDAKRSGIHPLAALGANVQSAAPLGSATQRGSSGDFIGRMGQNVSRAVTAVQTSEERKAAKAYNVAMMAENLRGAKLRNDAIAAQLAVGRQAGQGPAVPAVRKGVNPGLIPGQGDMPAGIKVQKSNQVASGKYGVSEAAATPGIKWIKTGKNKWMPVKGEGAAQSMDDDIVANLVHAVDRHWQMWSGNLKPPFKAPKGMMWKRGVFHMYLEKQDQGFQDGAQIMKGVPKVRKPRVRVPAKTRRTRRKGVWYKRPM